MHTYDSATGTFRDSVGNVHAGGSKLPRGCQTRDGRTVDSTGAFLLGELERLDPKLHDPLAAVTWSRDIPLREDVTIADEASSYTITTYGSASGAGTGAGTGQGIAWISKDATQVAGVGLDIAKVVHPLNLWGLEIHYTIPELESAAKLGRPIDEQKTNGLHLKHQMDIDQIAYVGDGTVGSYGLLNQPASQIGGGVTPQNLPPGVSGFTQWAMKTPQEILADFNFALVTVWANSAFAEISNRVGIPPAQYGLIATTPVTQAGNVSILRYVEENNLLAKEGRGKLEIVPMKWCLGAGAGGTLGVAGTVDRMVVYLKDKERVRLPLCTLQKTPISYDSIWLKRTYFCRIGAIEPVYPTLIGYFDGC